MRLTYTLLLAFPLIAPAQILTLTEDGALQLPAPEWRSTNGRFAHAELRIPTENAAALRVNFASLTLPDGAQMFLYGRNANGQVVAAHGPYTGYGPLNIPHFGSEVLAGSEVVIAVDAPATSRWPFSLSTVDRFTPEALEGKELLPLHRPEAPRKYPVDIRSAYIGDQLVQFSVQDGIAVMEGDMVLGAVDFTGKDRGRGSFPLVQSLANKWPGGVMPYTIEYSTKLPKGGFLETSIFSAIQHWNEKFPGVIKPRTTEKDYVTFHYKAGACRATVGRVGGQQFVDLESNCNSGAIVHEIGHAVGFMHEHQRYDRKDYIRVHMGSILPEFQFAFEVPSNGVAALSGEYDFNSVMHYPIDAFIIEPGLFAFEPIVSLPADFVIGNRWVLSAGDEAGMRARYCYAPDYTAPSYIVADALGDTVSFTVTMPPYCNWKVSESSSWVSVSSPLTGMGATTVTLKVYANSAATWRQTTINVGGKSVVIKQEPAGY